MVINGEASRHSMAVALSLVGHAVVLSLLASGAFVRLSVDSSPLVLTLVEPGATTAGPGATDPRLRVAAAPSRPVASPPVPAAASTEPAKKAVPPSAAEVIDAPPPLPSKPDRPVEEARRPEVAASTSSPKSPPAETPPSPSNAETEGVELASRSSPAEVGRPDGADQTSTAPSWAPQARVRYEELLFAWMDRYKLYPMLARRRGLEGSGSVRVRIDREGRVVDRSIQRSTGELMLDRAALDMIRRANPFPAVPAEYAGEGFEFVAPIQYRLR